MTNAAPDFKHAPRERNLSRLNKILLALIAFGIVTPLAYQVLPIVKEKSTMQAALADAEKKVELARMKRNRFKREVTLLKIDPDYLGLFARDILGKGYMAKGETIFQFPRESQQ